MPGRCRVLGCVLWFTLLAPVDAVEKSYEIQVFFDRDQFLPGDKNRSPLLFRQVMSGKLTDDPIPLALNDVVRIDVKATSPGTFKIDEWEWMEVLQEKKRSWLKTTIIVKKLPRSWPVNCSLDRGVFLGVRFPGDTERDLILKEGANPERVIDQPGLLQCTGIVDRTQPAFEKRMPGSEWEGQPQQRKLKNLASTPLYTLTVRVRR